MIVFTCNGLCLVSGALKVSKASLWRYKGDRVPQNTLKYKVNLYS